MAAAMIATPHHSSWGGLGVSRRRADSMSSQAAPSAMKAPWNRPANASALSCPYWWSSSAGSRAMPTETKFTAELHRSKSESSALADAVRKRNADKARACAVKHLSIGTREMDKALREYQKAAEKT